MTTRAAADVPLSVRVHTRFDDVGDGEWRALVDRCPDSTVFQTLPWLESWAHCCMPDGAQVRLFAAYRGERLVGLAPLWIGHYPDADHGRPRLQFLGLHHADYLTFPAEDASPEIVRTLLDAVDGQVPRDVGIDFDEIPQLSTLATCLAERSAESRSGVLLRSITPCPRLRIRDNDAGVHRVLRKKSIRRHSKQLARLGDVVIDHLSDPGQIAPLLEAFFDQHVRRWASTPYPSLFNRSHNRRFYQEFVSRLGVSGDVVFTVLRVDGRAAAQHLGLRSTGHLLWYKPAFDVTLGRCSPGEVMLKSLVEFAQEQSFAAVDFTRGDEPFKARFASEITYNCSYSWARSATGRFLARLGRLGCRLRRTLAS